LSLRKMKIGEIVETLVLYFLKTLLFQNDIILEIKSKIDDPGTKLKLVYEVFYLFMR
jgi:hypothetical protein